MFTQIPLGYSYDALEPHIDAATVETHYAKHHVTYTKNFNDAAEKAGVSDKSVEEILAGLDSIGDEAVRKALRNNGGGFYNHNLYFENFSPEGGEPEGAFADAVKDQFGSLDELIGQLSQKALAQFGSGWSFLSADKEGKLYVTASPNQDNPISENTGRTPLLALDVWEHAYYLKYRNLRGDYIKAFFNVVDWKKVSDKYQSVI